MSRTSKFNLKTALVASLLIIGLPTMAGAENSSSALKVNLKGLQPSTGALYISVQTQEDYMSDRMVAGAKRTIDASDLHSFDFNIPEGDYAVSVWHDLNNDEQFSMDENWVPTDGWAVSGNPSPNGRPTFDQVKISVTSGDNSITIPMIYP